MSQAKSDLSRLVKAIEDGREREIIVLRHGRPVAKPVPIDIQTAGRRLGVAAGKFSVPDDIDAGNNAIARLAGCTGR